jgi:hypothetical protein
MRQFEAAARVQGPWDGLRACSTLGSVAVPDQLVHPSPARTDGSPTASPGRRRLWPWVVGAVLLVLGLGAVTIWLTTNRARPVSMQEAQQGLGSEGGSTAGATTGRPVPGVYRYTGSGSERLTLPPLSQPEGPTMPGTVTLQGGNCWTFRIDYSSHHWQTWNYCLHQGDMWETGGKSWQLWSIGPLGVTNLSTFTCAAGTMALPVARTAGQVWQSSCTGKNSSVGGSTLSAGPYRFLGSVTMHIGRTSVRAAHFLRLRTESGAQNGTERTEAYFDEDSGLVLRLQQDIVVSGRTPFGTSTFTQVGTFTLASLTPRR